MAKKSASSSGTATPSTATPTVTTGTTVTPVATTTTPSASSKKTVSSTSVNSQRWDQIALNIVDYYQKNTPQRTKLIDAFMAFLVLVGGIQFLYCILAGNYPFNAFLSGFGATVGQFVLTASLRIQTTEANKSDFPAVSPERAFADFLIGSLILHFFCVNFIN